MNLQLDTAIANSTNKQFYKDGLPFMFSAWVSPNRKECYHKEIIILSSEFDAGDTNNDFFDEFYAGSIFDLFGENDTGLYYVTGKVHSEFTTDYYGEIDHEFVVDEVSKEKCVSWSHLREVYQTLIKPNI